MGAFTKIFQKLRLTSDASVTTQTATVIQADTTDSSLVIKPNGTGALVAAIPDGLVSGGNARGSNAVDLQMARDTAVKVASGLGSTIIGGFWNRATNDYSVVLGGFNNAATGNISIVGGSGCTATGTTAISLGASNTASSTAAVVSGGQSNTASSANSTVSGGQSNTASTGTHSTVVGGQSNTASGQHSVAGGTGTVASGGNSFAYGNATTLASGSYCIALGNGAKATAEAAKCLSTNSTVSASYGAALGGFSNTVSGSNAVAIGTGHTITGGASVCLGSNGNGYLANQIVNSSSSFAQSSYLNAYRYVSLTTAATTVISLDGTGVTALIIPTANRAWNVTIKTIVVVAAISGTATGVTVGDTYSENKNLLFKRVAGTSSIVGTVDTSNIKSNTSMSSSAITITAGASQEMVITFTAPTFVGGGSVACRIVSKVELTEADFQL